jgi:hypothetical protein
MPPEDRLGLAQLSYLRALAEARARPTARASWRRVLTAARNLAEAKRRIDTGGTLPSASRRAPARRPGDGGG